MEDNAIVVFTRYPEPGQTKTRLIPALGEEGAANFHKNLMIKILGTVVNYTSGDSSEFIVSFSDSDLDKIKKLLGPDLNYCKQREGHLGQKLKGCFKQIFKNDYKKALIIGSDIPEIGPQHLEIASKKLDTHEIVLGPAYDGGYYLIGMTASSFSPRIFENIEWGGSTVLENTLDRIKTLNQDYYLLPELKDIDTPEDLNTLKNNNNQLYQLLTEGL